MSFFRVSSSYQIDAYCPARKIPFKNNNFIIQLFSIQELEKERMDNEILKIKTENEFCEKMAKKFISEEIDVLPLHPHVRIMNLGKRDFGCCLPTAK